MAESNDVKAGRAFAAKLAQSGKTAAGIVADRHAMAEAARLMSEELRKVDAEMQERLRLVYEEATGLDAECLVAWKAEYGEPFPQSIADLKRWLARADVPGRFLSVDKVASGEWTPGDLLPFIEGHLLRMKDAAATLAAEGAKPAEPVADGLTGEEKALALLVGNPTWSDTAIARAVPCGRTSLYRWPRYVAAREALEFGRQDRPHADEL